LRRGKVAQMPKLKGKIIFEAHLKSQKKQRNIAKSPEPARLDALFCAYIG